MTVEIAIIISLVGMFIGVATFFIGRQSAANSSGREWGEIKTDIGYIKSDLKDIKLTMKDISNDYSTAIQDESKERSESVRRLHQKFDEHMVKFHGYPKGE